MRINAVGGLRRTQTSNQTIDRLIDAGDTRLDHSPASDIGIAVPAAAVPHRGLFSSEIRPSQRRLGHRAGLAAQATD